MQTGAGCACRWCRGARCMPRSSTQKRAARWGLTFWTISWGECRRKHRTALHSTQSMPHRSPPMPVNSWHFTVHFLCPLTLVKRAALATRCPCQAHTVMNSMRNLFRALLIAPRSVRESGLNYKLYIIYIKIMLDPCSTHARPIYIWVEHCSMDSIEAENAPGDLLS